MDKHYTLWVKSHCPFCIKAVDELRRRKLDRTVFVMDDKPEQLDSMKAVFNHPTVPIITIKGQTGDEELIGGYTNLLTRFAEQNEEQND
jgi:glutaredoxin